MSRARTLADDIDLDLAWTFAPEGEFGFADLARDYYDAKAGVEKQAAALFRLFDAPHYFRRLGKGQFKKAPEEIVKAALIAIERKKQVAAQIDAWAGELLRANARRRCASSSTRSCSSPTRTRLNTRPSSKRRNARSARRSTC